jgi:hypothetical protein
MEVRMKKLAMVVGLTVLLSGAGLGAAHADDTYQGSVEVKAGVLTANGTNMSNSGQLTIGGEYEFTSNAAAKNGGTALSVSADWVQVDRLAFAEVGGFLVQNRFEQTVIPVLLNLKLYSSGDINRLYAGVGAGAMFGDYGGFAYQLEAGYQFDKNWDLSVRYIGNGGSTNVQGSTLTSLFGADIGYKF